MRDRACFALALAASACFGCGGSPRSTDALQAELAALELDTAGAEAPDLVQAARAALEQARAAEARGDLVATSDFAVIARLTASTAVEESARIRLETETLETERETLDAEARVLAAERASSEAALELTRSAAARTAREAGAAALVRAELDEARPGRAAHLSLTQSAEVRAAATAIRARARLLRAAAVAMGATSPASLEDLLARSEASHDHLEALALADRAHEAARGLLGDARRAAPGVDAARIASLVEAASSEGFHPITLERGTAIELDHVFDGASARPSAAGAARLGRLATLLSSYPDGAVLVEVDAATTADATRLSPGRATAVVHALVQSGLPASRVSAAVTPGPSATPAPGVRVRAVLVAYASATPPSGGAIVPTPAPEPSQTPSGESD